MNNLGKINTRQLIWLGQNQSVSLMVLLLAVVVSNFLPYYLSPVITLGLAAFLYYFIYNIRLQDRHACIIPSFCALYTVVLYSFITIVLNILHIWGVLELPKEFVFFTHPFIPALILNPILLIVSVWLYFRHQKLKMCVECRLQRSMGGMRGASGVLVREFHFQLTNFIILSAVLTAIVWVYYQWFYIDVNINARDSYIFTWLTIIGFVLDGIYFTIRYYNLYLDMKESRELIYEAELRNLIARTFVRFYVVKGNKMYVSSHMHDPNINTHEVIDTPFFTGSAVNGLHISDVKRMIAEKTGVNDGELRFFYGKKSENGNNFSLLRYFYFIDGDEEEWPQLAVDGEWMDFDKIKYLYSTKSNQLAELAMHDISRLATIILTEKVFDEKGYRKMKLKSYQPSFNLIDVRNSKLDFQDDKWINISMFNSDSPLFHIKRWWKRRFAN